MEPLEYIRQGLDKLKNEGQQLPFDREDMRLEFFGLLYDVLNNYYYSATFFELTKYLGTDKILFSKDFLTEHLKRVTEIGAYDVLWASYRNNINRSVIVDTWSVFEFCITIISLHVLDESEQEELKLEKYLQIVDSIKGIIIPEKSSSKLKKQFSTDHLSHVSINRKCDKLFKKVGKNYQRDLVADRQFLTFFGKYRNSMHSNYIYYGKDFEFAFKGVKFQFIDKDVVTNNVQFGITYNFELAMELKDIFKELTTKLNFKNKIPYPVEDAP